MNSQRLNKKRKEKGKINLYKIDWEKAKIFFEPEKKQLFEQLKEEISRYPYVKEILVLLAAGVFISASLVMPGLPLALKPFLWNGKGYQKKRLKQVFKRLYKQKLVKIKRIDGQSVISLTEKGIAKALNFRLGEMKIKKPPRWDRKWRVIIFDIPENLKPLRDIFRERLKNLGCYRLQDSVFVHPYPCFEQIEFLRQVYQVEIGVTYIVAEKIEGQEALKEFFDLS